MSEAAFKLEPVVFGPLPKPRIRRGPGYAAQKNRAKKRKYARVKKWLAQYKAQHPCACGENDPACLDFHHVGETKNMELSDSRRMGHVLRELPFCIVVCANCHRKLHAREGDEEPKLL